jgi:hypothetical protein
MAKVIFGSKAQAIRSIITTKYFKEGGLDIPLEAAKGIRIIGPSNKEDLWDPVSFALGDYKNSIVRPVLSWLNSINWQAIFGWFVGGVQFLFTFNWQTSDEEFEQAIAAAELSWYGQLGETLGVAAGWFLCGVVPSLLIGTVNEAMMLHVLQDVSEEAFDEITGELSALLQMGARQQMNKAAAHLFMGIRALIKRAANGDADPLLGGAIDLVFKAFPNVREAAKTWGNKGNKPWTIAGAIQDSIESLPEGNLKEFVEEFVDALGESCINAGYVVAGGVDNFIMEQKLAKRQQLGQERVVEVLLNRNDPSSKIIVAGPEEFIKQSLITQKNEYQLMQGRDVGQWVGEPLRESLKTPPISIQMRILLSDKEKTLTGAKRKQITIPNVDRAKIDWANLKTALGGSNGYMWGRFRGKAVLDTGHTLDVYANSEQQATELLESLVSFSKSEILTVTVTEEQKIGVRKKWDTLYKQDTRIYPIKFTIINQVKVLNEESGIVQPSGIYKRKNSGWIDLTGDTKPDDFEETLTELFKTPGPNG